MKYHIETYGCQMNVHESEKIAGSLKELGYSHSESINEADIVIYNTCCIRDTAEKKIVGNIGDAKHLKAKNKDIIIAVVGCMSQQEGSSTTLKDKFPFIDIILGTTNIHLLPQYVKEILSAKEKKRLKYVDIKMSAYDVIREDLKPFRTSGTNAWVNIMYGCNNFCSYCIVPHVRGRERSRNSQLIIDEVKGLLDEGYKEITLLGQNVNSYGKDKANNEMEFSTLLGKIASLPYKFRLRFMTSHPKDFNKSIVDTICAHENLCKSIHLPVQSGSNRILGLMNRKYTREDYLALVDMIRSRIPDCGITSDIITGFPTETEEEFEETLDLVKQVRFSTAFTFVYSPRKGTVAAGMEQLAASVKKERIKKLVALQNSITEELSHEYLGKTYEVLVEDVTKTGLCGRTESGRLVNFFGDKELYGKFVKIKITKHRASALFGEVVV